MERVDADMIVSVLSTEAKAKRVPSFENSTQHMGRWCAVSIFRLPLYESLVSMSTKATRIKICTKLFAAASSAMARVFEKSLTRKDKEKDLMISNAEASLHLLPGQNSKLIVKSENRCMVFEFEVHGESSCIIRGREWREFIGNYSVGSIVTLYRDDDGNYKIQVR
ncbi:Uncharacterized protein TCM_030779 [Theobroma cacao]|uniref:TF-B3 domain-containing protein n=1 Tax=Theobroma cacao TaxID=3641 RepID=A0A061F4I0_THECC|nr:Uncharacterized protein TCM_030779 [Theobroma cacao]